ncbi:hypothetical protein ACIA5D_35600 [Actinoplanes sp. NPDC051513]|uniref:hypothetical protein n=1 Tax=Actinoplanes sp. NPDC051513 TaxID=3363908 RepID=UPI003790EFBA
MISWISLLPPAPSDLPATEAFAALDPSAWPGEPSGWPGERARLVALQWQAAAARPPAADWATWSPTRR